MIYLVSPECFTELKAGNHFVPHGKTYSILYKDHRDKMPWLDQDNLEYGRTYTVMPNEADSKKRLKVKCVSTCPCSIVDINRIPK